jgi:putative acetyltransferase
MNNKIIVSKTQLNDIPKLETLYKEAFVDEDLFPLVVELLGDTQNSLHLSAKTSNGELVGHIAFTKCYTSPEQINLSLLGPMAVLPSYQRQGVGKKLIQKGLSTLKQAGIIKVLVLGDPNYYSRSGFATECSVEPAYKIPDEWKTAWQSISLQSLGLPPSGKLNVTTPWQRRQLWSD